MYGACHVFASALHEQFGYPLVLVRENGARHVAHVFCRSEAFAVDVMGFTPEKDILESQKWIAPCYSAEVITPPDMETFYVCTYPSDGGLYADDAFLRQARRRAERRITDYIRFYDGACRCTIRPHSFLTKTTDAEIDDVLR